MKMEHLIALAGLDEKKVAETLKEAASCGMRKSKKKTMKEGAYEDLKFQFGSLGEFVAQELDIYADSLTDPEYADSDLPSESADSLKGYIEDRVKDTLVEIFASEAYKRLATEVAGQVNQANQQPGQGVLNV